MLTTLQEGDLLKTARGGEDSFKPETQTRAKGIRAGVNNCTCEHKLKRRHGRVASASHHPQSCLLGSCYKNLLHGNVLGPVGTALCSGYNRDRRPSGSPVPRDCLECR